MKRMLCLFAALCLSLCLTGSGAVMESDGTNEDQTEHEEVIPMDEDLVEYEEIETTPIDEALGENLAELDDPEKTLDSLYRVLNLAYYLQNGPMRSKYPAPSIEECILYMDILGIDYSDRFDGTGTAFEEDGTRVYVTVGFSLPGEIEIRFYKPGILLADDASDEEVDAAYEKVREGRFIEHVQIEISKFRYPSFVLCDFRK